MFHATRLSGHDKPCTMPRPTTPRALIATLEERVRRLELELAARNAELAHARKTFDHASVAARIGVWECDLATNTLTWTDTVYDMFDLPRGSLLNRDETVRAYTPESAARLDCMRRKAIAELGSFSLDADIVTRRGVRRVIRVTASVEAENGVAVRLFGMKQDITEEQQMLDRMRYLANFDTMTGLANRARFQSRLADGDHPVGGLMLVDLDGFKQINDTHGHQAGDICLRRAADRLAAICIEVETVARIGGDEFAVLLPATPDPACVADMAARIVEGLAGPVVVADTILAMGASVGVAFTRAGDTPELLFARADAALYTAKASGRGTFHIG